MPEETFEYESIQDSRAVRQFIISLLEDWKKGAITLATGGEEIRLHPADLFKFSVRAQKQGVTGKISLKISWREETEETAGPERLTIK